MGDCLVSSRWIAFYSSANNKMYLLHNKKEIVMAQYIEKTALVAEIERLKDEYLKHCKNIFHAERSCWTLDNILSFVDTLEMKEVDLEKELNEYGYHYDYVSLTDRKELMDFAKHFFELGLKAQKGD